MANAPSTSSTTIHPSPPTHILTTQRVAVSKAKKSAKAVATGTAGKTARKVRYTTTFRLPKTLALPRRPTYVRRSAAALPPVQPATDAYSVIKAPLATESAMRKMETCNTLVFLCDTRANKHHIRAAVKELYGVEAVKVNTLVRPDGVKKAYIRLSAEQDAMDVAGKIGFI